MLVSTLPWLAPTALSRLLACMAVLGPWKNLVKFFSKIFFTKLQNLAKNIYFLSFSSGGGCLTK